MTDPFDVLRSHVRSVALLERPDADPDDLVDAITGAGAPNIASRSAGSDRSQRSNVVPLRSPRRRRWLVATGAVVIVVAGGAGVAAFRGERPAAPSADVLCHGSVDATGSAIAIAPTDDPIAGCSELWRNGDLPNIDALNKPTTDVPRLVACTGINGSLEVLPLPELTSCADFGLSDAGAVSVSVDPVTRLRDDLMVEINSGPCLGAPEVEQLALDAIARSGLARWKVEVADPESDCATVAIEPETSRVIVRSHPSATALDQEKP